MPDTNETVQVPPDSETSVGDPGPNAVESRPSVEPAPVTAPAPRRRSSGVLVALAVLILLAAVIATAFTLVANRMMTIADMRTLLELILGPLFTLAGAALGFYFANR